MTFHIAQVSQVDRLSHTQAPAGDLSATRRRIDRTHQPPARTRPPTSRRAPNIARPAPEFCRVPLPHCKSNLICGCLHRGPPHTSASSVNVSSPRTVTACPVYAPPARDSAVRARSSAGHPEESLSLISPRVQRIPQKSRAHLKSLQFISSQWSVLLFGGRRRSIPDRGVV